MCGIGGVTCGRDSFGILLYAGEEAVWRPKGNIFFPRRRPISHAQKEWRGAPHFSSHLIRTGHAGGGLFCLRVVDTQPPTYFHSLSRKNFAPFRIREGEKKLVSATDAIHLRARYARNRTNTLGQKKPTVAAVVRQMQQWAFFHRRNDRLSVVPCPPLSPPPSE